jgi:rRNA-processing arch domain
VYIKQTVTVEAETAAVTDPTVTDTPTVSQSTVSQSTVTTIDWGWGVIVDLEKKNRLVKQTDNNNSNGFATEASTAASTESAAVTVSQYFVNCLVYAVKDSVTGALEPVAMTDSSGSLMLVQVMLQDITVISAARLQMPPELKQPSSRMALSKSLQEVYTTAYTYVHIYVYIVCTYTLAFLLYIDYMYRVITVCIQTTAVALTIMQQQVATALCDAAVFA